MKAGFKTTEFWIALVAQIVPILVLLGVISPDEAEAVTGSANQLIEAIFNLAVALTPVLTTVAYIWSRTKVKLGE